jgi:carboxypeptidase family protein
MRVVRSRITWSLALLFIAVTAAFGQNLVRGSIAGTVTDETGGALPGVTVTLTSPALQVASVLRVTDAEGKYQFPDLGAATYKITYELPGFATIVREGFALQTAFSARADVSMKVATIAETITVSGESPVIDVSDTRGGVTVSKNLLTGFPLNSTMGDAFLLVGGVLATAPPLTGEASQRLTAGSGSKTYGFNGASVVNLEGIVVQSNEAPNLGAVDEVDVKTYGNTAEVADPASAITMVVKAGGNNFHGRYQENYQTDRFSANNISLAQQAQGINPKSKIHSFQEFTGDLGGRIVRDKLWFYGAGRYLNNAKGVAGYSKDPGPDGVFGTADDIPGVDHGMTNNKLVKVSFQATQKQKVTFLAALNPITEANQSAGPLFPEEATVRHRETAHQTKLEWQGTLSNRLVLSALVGASGYYAYRRPQTCQTAQRLCTPSNVISRLDLQTSIQTGTVFTGAGSLLGFRHPERYPEVIITADYLAGPHSLQVGTRFQNGTWVTNFSNQPGGNYELVYDTVGGVAHQPSQMIVYNRPVIATTRQHLYVGYVQDSWRPTKRLTINMGLRYQRNVNWIPAQSRVDGPFSAAGSFAAINSGTWQSAVPRTGVSFDLSGDGRTVLKGTYGLFVHEWPTNYNIGQFAAYNQNSLTTTTYRWRDLNGNNNYDPGEVNLSTTGLDFISIAGAANTVPNLKLKQIHTHEVSSSLEQELWKGVSLRTLYVYKRLVNNINTVNVARPYNVYDQVFTRKDPGPDGILNTADDGGLVTLYDYNPAYRGTAFVSNTFLNTTPGRNDTFHNLDLSLNKRQSGGKIYAYTALLLTKYHRWLVSYAQSANDNLNPVDDTLEVAWRAAVGFDVPMGFNLSVVDQMYSGMPGQRTYLFRAADPAGGPAFPSSTGGITQRVGKFGDVAGPKRNLMNFRATRAFHLGGGRTFRAQLDIFNVFNSNVTWGNGTDPGIIFAEGPTYGYPTLIVTPRIAQFGVVYEF